MNNIRQNNNVVNMIEEAPKDDENDLEIHGINEDGNI